MLLLNEEFDVNFLSFRVEVPRQRNTALSLLSLKVMYVEICVAVALAAIYWYFNIRMPVQHMPLQSRHTAPVQSLDTSSFDYVIVGGGCGGFAALSTLIESSPENTRILLLERGKESSGGMLEILSFTHDLIGSNVDSLMTLPLPLLASAAAENATNSVTTPGRFQVPYPRGRAIGGTQQLDWSVVYHAPLSLSRESLIGIGAARKLATRLTASWVSLPSMRSPLSWAFAQSCGAHRDLSKHLPKDPTDLDPCGEGESMSTKLNSVFPSFMWLNRKSATRPTIARCIYDNLAKSSKGFTIATRATVESLVVEDGRVTAIRCRDLSTPEGKVVSISVTKGVVLAAGNFGTPHLAAPLLSPTAPNRLPFVDSVTVPLLYQAQPGLSDDPVNIQSMKNIFAWYLARRGPILNVLTDTQCLFASKRVPGMEVLVTFVPCGGFSRHRFAKMGLSPSLGVFAEAFTFYLSIHKVPAAMVDAYLAACTFGCSGVAVPSANRAEGGEFIPAVDFFTTSPEIQRGIVAALGEGIELCRELVGIPPLAKLSSKKEALDTTLMPKEDSKQIFQVLYAPTKKTKSADEGVVQRIREKARLLACSQDYLEKYVRRHSRMSGFASGSMYGMLATDADRNLQLRGVRNVFIGDTSVVEPMDSLSHSGLHVGASSTAALYAGSMAASQLLEL